MHELKKKKKKEEEAQHKQTKWWNPIALCKSEQKVGLCHKQSVVYTVKLPYNTREEACPLNSFSSFV